MARSSHTDVLRALQERDAKRYRRRERKGKLGERWAAEFLSLGTLHFLRIDGGKYDKPDELARRKGKRADFIVEAEDAIALLDAKHHNTDGCTWFGLPEEEVFAFEAGQEFIQDIMTKEDDRRRVCTFMMCTSPESI